MSTTQKLRAGIAMAVIAFVFAPQAWAADSVSAKSAAAAVSASSSAIPVALQKALALPEGKERDKAAREAAVEWQKSDPAAALAWVGALPMPVSMSNRGLIGAVSQAWANRDPAAAVACAWGFVKGKSSNFGNELGAFHLTLVRWSELDPKAAMAWADATVPADSSAGIKFWVYGSIADGWGRGGWARLDPVAAAAWAETVKDDKNRLVMVNAVAMLWSRSKPEDAAVWAKRLPPAELKSAAGPIFNAWRQRDAAQATAWLDSLTLPDEMKADLKKKAESTKPKP